MMVMNSHDWALTMAGVIGIGIAIVHGVLVQRLMVTPFQRLAGSHFGTSIPRLVPALLNFSTFNWLIGGIALIVCGALDGRREWTRGYQWRPTPRFEALAKCTVRMAARGLSGSEFSRGWT